MSIDPEESLSRAETARRIRHSTEMEGGRTGRVARADQDAYVRGEIDEEELLRRFRARHDLPH